MNSTPNLESRLLNLGCGRHHHGDWLNVDLVAYDSRVLARDLTRGVPFDANRFDAVYHSHVLEHLEPEAGRSFLSECFRVLAPGGVLRIAVPDLEQIARHYLRSLEGAVDGRAEAVSEHEWMKLELLDQMVRTRSGGLMGITMRSASPETQRFIRSRMGGEMFDAQADLPQAQRPSWLTRRWRRVQRLGDKVMRSLIKRLYGPQALAAWDEARFRGQGEIHRWMYDRFDLAQLLQELGFEQVQVCGADESRIARFADYGLDAIGGQTRKPDSLFIEAIKPRAALEQRAHRRQAA